MRRTSALLSILCFTCLILTAACSTEPSNETNSPATSSAGVETTTAPTIAEIVPNGREFSPGVITGGQPSKKVFKALQDAGVRTVINLRVPTEQATRNEPAWMKELGFEYVSIPVSAKTLNRDVAVQLDQALENAERPVLVHCGSSNRVGAAFALRAFHLEGKSPDEALEIGRSAGLTKLEPAVSRLLK